MQKLLSLFSILAIISFLSACSGAKHITRYDENNTIADPKKGVIVGLFSEGFLTAPHKAVAFFETTNIAEEYGGETGFGLVTSDKNDAIAAPNIVGQYFAIEAPPGDYTLYDWRYIHYRGKSVEPENPITFKVKSGETVYIGNIHAVSLNMCLNVYSNYDEDVQEIRKHFPLLSEVDIIDASQDFDQLEWPHEKYAEIAKPGQCATIDQLTKQKEAL